MYIAKVQFQHQAEMEDSEGLIHTLLGLWRGNGQVLGREFSIVAGDGIYSAYLMLPETDALSSTYKNQYVKDAQSWLVQAGMTPVVTILGVEPFSADVCSCSQPSFYILYTTYISLESSLRCGDCFGPVPLYRIPNHYMQDGDLRIGELHDHIISWQSDYQACDQLQMNCSTGERFGLREMSQFNSSLSQRGRKICEVITETIDTPAFYYLHRYKGRNINYEKKRCCPSCGGDWLLVESLHRVFDFKCDRCRLLSNIALEVR